MSRGVTGELYLDVLNLFDIQPASAVDPSYVGSGDQVLPISGGSYGDVIWLRANDANANMRPAVRNPDFGRATARYAPTSAKLGARVSF